MSGHPTTKGVTHYRIAQRNAGKLAPLPLGNKIPIPPSNIPRQPTPPPRPPPPPHKALRQPIPPPRPPPPPHSPSLQRVRGPPHVFVRKGPQPPPGRHKIKQLDIRGALDRGEKIAKRRDQSRKRQVSKLSQEKSSIDWKELVKKCQKIIMEQPTKKSAIARILKIKGVPLTIEKANRLYDAIVNKNNREVIRIQKLVRGALARQKLRHEMEAATRIQKQSPARQTRRKKNQESTRIQKQSPARQTRRKKNKVEDRIRKRNQDAAARIIQRQIRARNKKPHPKRVLPARMSSSKRRANAAKKIQTRVRGKITRRNISKQKKAAINIQRIVRGKHIRKNSLKVKPREKRVIQKPTVKTLVPPSSIERKQTESFPISQSQEPVLWKLVKKGVSKEKKTIPEGVVPHSVQIKKSTQKNLRNSLKKKQSSGESSFDSNRYRSELAKQYSSFYRFLQKSIFKKPVTLKKK